LTLTVTNSGSATSISAGATLVASGINASVGDWLVAFVAADNNGASGAASLTSVQDSTGNTWTQRALINNSAAGVAADGVTLGIWTCRVTNALAAGTFTANFSPNTTAKACHLYRIQPGVGDTITFIACDTVGNIYNTASAFAAPTVLVKNGDTVFGIVGIQETGTTFTGDSDTTNGSWSAAVQSNATTGTASTSMRACSQWKTVNADGNQDWNSSIVSARVAAATYLVISPLAPTPAPPVLSNPFIPFLVR
jgi:hypothetical protein